MPIPKNRNSNNATGARRESARQKRRERLQQVLPEEDRPDLTPVEEDERVQQLTQKLEAVEKQIESVTSEPMKQKEQAERHVEKPEENLVDAEAALDLGDATEEDVEEAEAELEDARSELEDAEHDVEVAKQKEVRLRRKAQILEDKLRQARQEASMRIEKKIRGALQKRAQEAVEELEEARGALERLYATLYLVPDHGAGDVPAPDWDDLPVQPSLRAGGGGNRDVSGRTRYMRLLATLEQMGADVPELDAEEYTEPQP